VLGAFFVEFFGEGLRPLVPEARESF
jgi:hypothetical protein